MALKLVGGICLVLCCASAVIYAEDPTGPGENSSGASPGLRSILRIYDECQRTDGGVAMCLKKKAVTFIDRVAKIDVINIGDGVKVVGVDGGGAKTPKSISENDLDRMLPRALEDRDNYLNNMLTEKLAGYISGRKIQISLPQVTSSDIGRGLEEGEFAFTENVIIILVDCAADGRWRWVPYFHCIIVPFNFIIGIEYNWFNDADGYRHADRLFGSRSMGPLLLSFNTELLLHFGLSSMQ